MLAVDGDHRPVDERRAGILGGVQLRAELPRRPEVVVVEEGDPPPARRLDAGVQRERLPAPMWAKHRVHARIVEGSELLRASVIRAVVDDDDLDLDILLAKRTRKAVA